jgi:hypothetical protein
MEGGASAELKTYIAYNTTTSSFGGKFYIIMKILFLIP